MSTVLLNFQLWRNFPFEDQMTVFSIIDKQLSTVGGLALTCLVNRQLIRIPIAVLEYYKMDASSDSGIKRKLSRESLLRLHLKLREVFSKFIINTLKQIYESRNK